MFKFLKKVLIKVLLLIIAIDLTIITKLYKIIFNFLIKNKFKIKKIYNRISAATLTIKGLCMQINLKKEFERCLINSK